MAAVGPVGQFEGVWMEHQLQDRSPSDNRQFTQTGFCSQVHQELWFMSCFLGFSTKCQHKNYEDERELLFFPVSSGRDPAVREPDRWWMDGHDSVGPFMWPARPME
jgi:hypothetical protein